MSAEEITPTTRELARQGLSDPEICRRMGWVAGTRLNGDEGYGPTIIRLTAIGERSLLAVTESHNGRPRRDRLETLWTLSVRDWTEATS
jgi:hypothetical protein